ncbi:hypothetical protein LJB87_01650, partial [Alistipes sp. OttesenSCG-928-L06]|nr:hypothetical protein [Alistipes sp. OttesenSCG-928-L06]
EESGSQNLENSVVQDVSVEYRLTDRDNMFLRAFRNNTQESMLESEVVETGVAFVMRKRLNKLGDLFKVMPKEERRERRAIRRELREARKNPEENPPNNESEQTQN